MVRVYKSQVKLIVLPPPSHACAALVRIVSYLDGSVPARAAVFLGMFVKLFLRLDCAPQLMSLLEPYLLSAGIQALLVHVVVYAFLAMSRYVHGVHIHNSTSQLGKGEIKIYCDLLVAVALDDEAVWKAVVGRRRK